MTNQKLTFKERIWHKWLARPYRLHTVDHGRPRRKINTSGVPTKPVVILLHGLASSSSTWDLLLPEIKEQYRCISIDLLGFGESPKPQWPEYTMEDHLKSINAAIRGLGLRQPFTLVGHSLGSLLATRYTRQYANRINRLILLSPPVYAPLYTIKNRAARQRTSIYLNAYKFLRSHKRFTPENVTKLSRILPQLSYMTLNRNTWTPFIRSLEQCIENQTLIDDIRHVQAPIDVFYGTLDEVVVPYNVRQLAQIREVNMHPLRVSHAVGKRYSSAVSKVLLADSDTK